MSRLVVLPAIDLRGGRCVRLRQGRPDEETTYSDDPIAVARRWVAEGAEWLHVVDLDGAFAGRPVHLEIVRRLVRAADVPVELGGGLRTDDDVQSALDAGVARVIVGTRALEQPDAVQRLTERLGERLAVGLDARDGVVQVRGWTSGASIRTRDLAVRLDREGVRTLIVTDIGRDGMLQGVNAAAVDEVCGAVGCRVIASGGVSGPGDVEALRALDRKNLWGAIAGRALYEGTVTLADLLRAAG